MPDRKNYLRRIRKGVCVYCGMLKPVKGLRGCRKCLNRQNSSRIRRLKNINSTDSKIKIIEMFGKTKIVEQVR